MKFKDIKNRKIIAIEQQRVYPRDHDSDFEYQLISLTLDNGKEIYFRAIETDYMPVVVAGIS